MRPARRETTIPITWDRSGLPAWAYHSPGLLELEKEHLFRCHWQIVCHVSDIPSPGDFVALDCFDERILALRGGDGQVRVFSNICAHRACRLVAGERGHCDGVIVCPFHGWTYNLDGRLRGPSQPRAFPQFDKDAFGLAPLEFEIWLGLIFVRVQAGPQRSVADLLAPFEAELSHYDIADMVPAGDPWTEIVPANWKSVRDVDNEGYHVGMAHPALRELYGATYYDEPYVDGIGRSFATFDAETGSRWSVRNYTRLASPAHRLPEALGRAWIYYGIFPNNVIGVTPQTVQFYQEFPLGTRETLVRGAVYRYRDEDRRQAAARYLAARIDRETVVEDVQLAVWSNDAMMSKTFRGFFLSDLEYTVRTHHDHLRRALPVLELRQAPNESEMAAVNDSMRDYLLASRAAARNSS